MDDSDDEACVYFGTRLPDPDEEPARKKTLTGALKQSKHVPYEEEAVTDEKGRPLRFHGAFTGGFSAGYFNTVGSKEGWQPATFVSSRGSRVGRKEQRPEDFMDTEDLSEFGIAPQRVMARRDFANDADLVSRFVDFGRTIIPESERFLKELVIPTRATVGLRLLRKMGYRESARSAQIEEAAHRVVGCSTGPLRAGDADANDAPIVLRKKDLNPVRLASHDNQFGLGYRSLRDSVAVTAIEPVNASIKPVGSARTSDVSRGRHGAPIRGAAFGVGVLNEDDEDFEDVYNTDRREKYDFAIGSRSGTESDDEAKASSRGNAKRDAAGRKEQQDKVTVLIEGFERARVSESRNAAALWPLPILPPNYVPKRPFDQSILPTTTAIVPVTSTITTSTATSAQSTKREAASGRGWQKHNAPERGALLGETEKRKVDVFTSERQIRFDAYCAAAKQQHQDPYSDVLSRFAYVRERTEWELAEEREQFARQYAAYVKPIHDLLRTRFVSSGVLDTNTPSQSQSLPQSTAQSAVFKIGSKVDRRINEWHPTRLLCKRFNVPPPFPENSERDAPTEAASANRAASTSAAASEQRVGKQLEQLRALFDDFRRQTPTDLPAAESASNSTLSELHAETMEKGTKQEAVAKNCEAESMLKQDADRGEQTTKPKTPAVQKSTKKSANTVASLFDVLDNEDEDEDVSSRPATDSTGIAPTSKPPVDLFKAIFTDSEPSDDGDDTEADTKAELPINQSADDQLNLQILPVRVEASPKVKHDAPHSSSSSDTSDSEEYGPAPPPRPAQDADHLSIQRSRQEVLQRAIAQSVDAAARADAEQELFEFVESRTATAQKHERPHGHGHGHRHRHRRRHQDGVGDRTKDKREKKHRHGHRERKSGSSHSRPREKRKRSTGYDASDSDA